jgi:uncharacterized protein
MKKAFLLLVFCFPFLINPAFSQTKKKTITELFKCMNQDSMTEKMLNAIIPVVINQMKNQFSPKDSTLYESFKEMMKSVSESTRALTKQMIDEEMIELYDKYFIETEINDFLAFYKSPAGQKFVKVTPDLMKDLMVVMTQKYMPEIQRSMKLKIEETLKNNRK